MRNFVALPVITNVNDSAIAEDIIASFEDHGPSNSSTLVLNDCCRPIQVESATVAMKLMVPDSQKNGTSAGAANAVNLQ